jgi:hypothetical protein
MRSISVDLAPTNIRFVVSFPQTFSDLALCRQYSTAYYRLYYGNSSLAQFTQPARSQPQSGCYLDHEYTLKEASLSPRSFGLALQQAQHCTLEKMLDHLLKKIYSHPQAVELTLFILSCQKSLAAPFSGINQTPAN